MEERFSSSNCPKYAASTGKYFICFLALLANTAIIYAQGTVSVLINSPASGAVVGDTPAVVVSVTSTFELQEVRVDFGGRTTNLIFSPSVGWTNALSLTGLPHGNILLTVTATDDFGSTGQATRTIDHDTPPILTVSGVPNGTVARPSVSFTFTAADDDPVGTSLKVEQASDFSGGPILATGTNTISTNVSLAPWDGTPCSLFFRATDSGGHLVGAFRQVYVQSSTNLVEVAKVSEGNIVDVHSDRILFSVPASDSTGPYLKIQSRADGSESVIFHQPLGVWTSFLAPEGGVSIINAGPLHNSSRGNSIFQFKSGVATELSFYYADTVTLRSRGNYAAWSVDTGPAVLGIVDLTSEAMQEVTNMSGGLFKFDIAANGDLVFSEEDISFYQSHSIYRYRSGVITLLATDAVNSLDYPKTDGSNVFFLRTNASGQTLVLLKDTGQSDVATGAVIGKDFLVNNGWVAYEKSGGGQTQIWRRSPEGTTSQLTFYGTSSTLAALNPHGEVAFYNGNQVYLSKGLFPPPAIAVASDSFSGLNVFWLDDRWYATMGRSLFQVYTGTPGMALSTSTTPHMFSIDLIGAIGQHLVTQTSSDGIHWTDVMTNSIADDATMTFQTSMDLQGFGHFYRLRAQ